MACFKEPHEITKIIRKANESLTAFKERWTVETGFIIGVPEVMKISSFMDSVKSPELAKRFSDKVPTMVNEMMERLDDFIRSEAAYANTELPKGEAMETHRRTSLPFNERDVRPFQNTRPMESRRDNYRNNYRGRDAYLANRAREDRAPYPPTGGEYNRRVAPVLTLNSLTKYPKEILATETQVRLPVPRLMLNPLSSGNVDRYCDYHQEKGHYTNDCIQLRKQLEIALESGKLNHLVKDARRRGGGSHGRDNPQPAKVVSQEPLIVEAEVEGYLVSRVYVNEGSSVEVMFEHCFENLNPKIKARLKETQTDLVGRTSMKFIMVRAPSPYNIILGRPGLKTFRAIPSTIHSIMKFPTPRGIATLVTRTVIITECRRLEKKQVIEEESFGGNGEDNMNVFAWESSDMTGVPRRVIEHALNVNPSLDPVCQKRRTFSMKKSGVVTKEVSEWVKA
ncbi:hypothetical protein Tco_0689288, partial [Tanacetum coccineum]